MTWPKPWRAFTTEAEMLRNRPAIACSRCRVIQLSSIVFPENEAEPGKPETDLRFRHEKLPQQPAPKILDHHDDRALVYGEKRIGIPVACGVEGIGEAVTAPDLAA